MIPASDLDQFDTSTFNSHLVEVLGVPKSCGRGFFNGFPVALLHLHAQDGYYTLSGEFTADGLTFLSHFVTSPTPTWGVFPLGVADQAGGSMHLVAFELVPR